MARTYPSIAYKLFIFCLVAALLAPAGTVAQDKGGGSEPSDLPEGLKGVAVSDTFIPLFAQAVGTVQTVKGRLIVRHGETVRAYYAAPGNQLYEKDVLYTLEDSRCRLQFVTDEIITMGANSHIGVDQVMDNRQAQEKSSIFSMLKGKAMFYALRLFRYEKVDVEVRTPVAVAGIRGTKFGVEVDKIGTQQASAGPYYLADASGRLPVGLLAQNTAGEGYQATFYGFDGEVEVTSTGDGSTQMLGPGENVVVGAEGAGQVMPAVPEQVQQFVEATDAPAEDTGGGEGAGGTGAGGTKADETQGAAMEDSAVDTAAAEAAATDFTQNQTTDNIQQESAAGTKVGYFSAMLILQDLGFSYLENVYASSSPQDFNSGTVKADGIYAPGYIQGAGTGIDNAYVQAASVDGTPAFTTALGPGYVINDVILGSNSYQEWGYWTMPQTFIIDVYDHNLLKGYYIAGELTPEASINGISGEYIGPAYGTYWNPTNMAGVDMAGSVYCTVDGLSSKITSFDLTVFDQPSSPNVMAAIVNASGTITGNSFKISPTTGDWQIILQPSTSPVVIPADYKSAQGSFYGPNGEFIGGAYGMKTFSGEGVAGIFQGEKFTPPPVPAPAPAPAP